jgi:PBP1b-binding outer membrane lipoprotein LpoB
MKIIASVLAAACLLSGCVSGTNVAHEDSPGMQQRDQGPALCHDGSTPPCNTRS